ncbi:MAG TPA: STN domain-containing protein, partial [Rhizomicrobium sp.]|nr:STN domain-containing protein [Rhizomicrobium sp.]
MKRPLLATRLLASAACATVFSTAALCAEFDIAGGSLAAALDAYSVQAGVPVVVSANAIRHIPSKGLKGDFSAPDALSRLLKGTGFSANPSPSGVVQIVAVERKSSRIALPQMELAQATPAPARSVETVTVTSSKLGGADVQSIPISITALSQEQLTATQTAGGPDLIKQVP